MIDQIGQRIIFAMLFLLIILIAVVICFGGCARQRTANDILQQALCHQDDCGKKP